MYMYSHIQIDRLFDWRRLPTSSVREAIKKQKQNTKDEFEERVRGVVAEFAEQVGVASAMMEERKGREEGGTCTCTCS